MELKKKMFKLEGTTNNKLAQWFPAEIFLETSGLYKVP